MICHKMNNCMKIQNACNDKEISRKVIFNETTKSYKKERFNARNKSLKIKFYY